MPALEALGISYAVHLPPKLPRSGLGRLFASLDEKSSLEKMAQDSRAVFIQKRLLPVSWIDRLAYARPLLFDFDDAIFTSPANDRSRFTRQRVEHRLNHVLSCAQTVIAGNRYLQHYAAQYAKNVVHLPTVLDSHRYPAKIHQETKPIVVGWIGHSVNHPYLSDLGSVLKRLASMFDVRLLVVSDRDLEMPGVPVENRRWTEATEIADILRMDIGLMPMPDDPWTRGKCGFKAIQYMAAGVPVICSAVGANLDIVRDGIDGFCVSTAEQWLECLVALCGNVDKRQHMGQSARLRVQESYSLESAIPIWHNILFDALDANYRPAH
ncbi:glycosyltransferase family 4 protein [Sulfuricystis multivorans]|uniref:glycosyltransferase family 4 protein n=1 Tax=Sulfuricystis multivorans TaxID=2211108 RepID=UPI001559B5F0|nr:glycosyltransferase family 4 protein [Sulfuricystis multivorans]